MSQSSILLLVYCGLTFAASMTGGALPSFLKLTHHRLQTAISGVAGLMLGLAVLGLLPHAVEQYESFHPAVNWLLAGFLIMFLLQRFLPFHHHDVEAESPVEPCGHHHSLAERSGRNLSWLSVALGLSLHSIFDGLAMASAVASGNHAAAGALGLGTALAVILHKPFGALAITTLMTASGAHPALRNRVNIGFALVTPVAALLIYFGVAQLSGHPEWLGGALAFCAGTFLCIACADLLPELQFHTHDRLKLSVALLVGVALAWALAHFAHSHEEENGASHLHSSSNGMAVEPASVKTKDWPLLVAQFL